MINNAYTQIGNNINNCISILNEKYSETENSELKSIFTSMINDFFDTQKKINLLEPYKNNALYQRQFHGWLADIIKIEQYLVNPVCSLILN